jgi:hypothetical protein
MRGSAIRSENIRNWVQTVASGITAIAVLVAGGWAYMQFVQGREYAAKMHIQNQADVVRLNDQLRLVRSRAIIENVGLRKIDLDQMHVCYRVIHPISEKHMPHVLALANNRRSSNISRLPLPCAEERSLALNMRIEPAESERILFDFVITSNDISTISVEVKVEHPKLDNFVWLDDILLDLSDGS